METNLHTCFPQPLIQWHSYREAKPFRAIKDFSHLGEMPSRYCFITLVLLTDKLHVHGLKFPLVTSSTWVLITVRVDDVRSPEIITLYYTLIMQALH